MIAEAAYLIDRQLGARAEASLYDSILSGELEIASLDREDWQRVRELVTAYADLPSRSARTTIEASVPPSRRAEHGTDALGRDES